jgi:hypothetical protein
LIQKQSEDAEKDGEMFSFYPNRFNLILSTEGKDILLENKSTRLLPAIVGEYRKEFNRKYGEEPLIAIEFADTFLEEYDYTDITRIFRMRLDNLIDLLDSIIEQAGFFRSKDTNLTFADIRYNAQVLKEIELVKAEAIIRDTRLTKNRENLIRKYKNQIKEIDLKKSKKESEALVATRLLKQMRQSDRYELESIKGKGEASVVLDSSFIQNLRENDYYSFLLKTAMSAGVEAGNLEAEKKYFEQEIISLNKKSTVSDTNQKEKKYIEGTEMALKKILNSIESLSKQTNELNREYLSKIIGEAIKIVRPPATKVIRSKNAVTTPVLAGIAGLLISVFLAFFIEYIRNNKPRART